MIFDKALAYYVCGPERKGIEEEEEEGQEKEKGMRRKRGKEHNKESY